VKAKIDENDSKEAESKEADAEILNLTTPYKRYDRC